MLWILKKTFMRALPRSSLGKAHEASDAWVTQANGSRTRYIRTYHRPSHCLPQRVAKKICRRALLFVGRSAKACVGRLLTARSGHACPLDLPSPVPPTTRVSPISNFKPLRSYPHLLTPACLASSTRSLVAVTQAFPRCSSADTTPTTLVPAPTTDGRTTASPRRTGSPLAESLS